MVHKQAGHIKKAKNGHIIFKINSKVGGNGEILTPILTGNQLILRDISIADMSPTDLVVYSRVSNNRTKQKKSFH